jgi:hypothetical protein
MRAAGSPVMHVVERAIARLTRHALVLAFAASPLVVPATSHADTASPDGCRAFAFDLSSEVALFATPGTPLASGTTAASAPTLEIGRVHAVSLMPAAAVTLPHAPEKPRLRAGARAALLAIDVPEAGRYRVTIDDASWIDVVRVAITRARSA